MTDNDVYRYWGQRPGMGAGQVVAPSQHDHRPDTCEATITCGGCGQRTHLFYVVTKCWRCGYANRAKGW